MPHWLYRAWVLVLIVPVQIVFADMQPARIGTHDTSLAKRIVFPDVPGDYTLFLRCEAKVLPAGTIEEAGCYGDKTVDEKFFRAVNLATNSASFMPASVDGEPVSVLALFSVIFRQQNGERVVAVVPNHGTNAKALGMNYTAPQRYGRANQYIPRSELGLLWLDAKMSADGQASDIKYIDTEWTNKESRRFAKSYITDNRFIPGTADGEPTSMRFVKPIFGYRNGFLVQSNSDKCRDTLIVCNETSSTTGRPRFAFDD